MAVLEIKKLNSPVLRRKCVEVGKINKEIKKLVVDMAQTMEKNNGIGISAPQVGILKRVIVVRTDFAVQRILCLVNPKIISKSKEMEMKEEGCLSFPGIYIKVKRPREIEVEGLDINGEKIKIKAKELLARVLQHEIDHLNGILFFDRLSFLKKLKFTLLNRPSV